MIKYPKGIETNMLVYDYKNNIFYSDTLLNFNNYIPKDTTLIFNDSNVISKRFYGSIKHLNSALEIVTLRKLSKTEELWECLINPHTDINSLRVSFNNDITASVIDSITSRSRVLLFNNDFNNITKYTALPKYLNRESEGIDEKYYNNYITNYDGSVIPSFTQFNSGDYDNIITRYNRAYITYHKSINEFRYEINEELYHYSIENYIITDDTAKIINDGGNKLYIGIDLIKAIDKPHVMSGDYWTNITKIENLHNVLCSFYVKNSESYKLLESMIGQKKVTDIYNMAKKLKYDEGIYGDTLLVLV